MGVKNLTRMLQRYAPNSIKKKTIQDYQNKTLVLDSSIFLRRFVHGNVEEILYPHIHGFYKLTLFLKQNGIKPIFIFDGKRRIREKHKEIAKRKLLLKKYTQNLDFEKNRKNRTEQWKNVFEKLHNLEETKHQYITSGIKQIAKEVVSPPASETKITSEVVQDIVQLSLQEMIVLLMYIEKVFALEHNKKMQIPTKQYVKTKIKDFKVIEKDKKLKRVDKKEKIPEIKTTTLLIDEPIMKTIENLKDEKKFKETHPDFEPSVDDVKLKEDLEQVIKMTLQDTTKLATDKDFTKAQREVGIIENSLVDSVLSGNKTLKNLETFEAENHNLTVKYEKRVTPITWKMNLESINFIKTLGIPCITFDGHEAEAMCASFVTFGFADGTVSEDMDTTIFGDGVLLRQFFQRNKPILEISPVEARKSLELSHDQYIDLCILCGTDFTETIRNVGHVTAFKLIKEYGSIENALLNLKPEKYLIAPGYIEEVEAARKLFKNPPKITKEIREQLDSNTEDIDEFNRLLEIYEIDNITNNEPLDYNVIVYDVNSTEDVNNEYLGPDPFSANFN